jgi:maltose alpha-D-glucosyltransferase/alpha-amylase
MRKENREPLVWILNRTPTIPKNCQWCTFLRNHDELTLEMVTPEERQWMWQEYAPEPRMRLNLGIRRRLAPLLDNDRRKIELANSLLFTLPGSPTIYYGDEIGMGDNIWLPDRNGVRTPMQWDHSKNAGFSAADPANLCSPVIDKAPYDPEEINAASQLQDPNSLLNQIRKMISVRKQHRVFGFGDFEWLDCDNPHIAAYFRQYEDQCILIINNLSAETQNVSLQFEERKVRLLDILESNADIFSENGKFDLKLTPHQYLWMDVSLNYP